VALNAAAAFVAAGLDPGLEQGIERAAGIIDSGKALEKLDALVEFTNRYGSFVRKEFA
jgi:anthranilate phosphoribosyltransferase